MAILSSSRAKIPRRTSAVTSFLYSEAIFYDDSETPKSPIR